MCALLQTRADYATRCRPSRVGESIAEYERLTLGAVAFRRSLQMLQFCSVLGIGGGSDLLGQGDARLDPGRRAIVAPGLPGWERKVLADIELGEDDG